MWDLSYLLYALDGYNSYQYKAKAGVSNIINSTQFSLICVNDSISGMISFV